MSLAAVTTVNPAALKIDIPQASKIEAKLAPVAPVSSVTKAAPTAGTGGGSGGGNGGGIGAGTGSGQGSGAGTGKPVHQIGKLEIKAEKICVILDVSASMTPNVSAAAEEAKSLALSTGGMLLKINGCSLDDAFVANVGAFAAAGADAVYWLCDLRDPQVKRSIEELSVILKTTKTKLYVTSWEKLPSPKLDRLIRKSGGAFEFRGSPSQIPAIAGTALPQNP